MACGLMAASARVVVFSVDRGATASEVGWVISIDGDGLVKDGIVFGSVFGIDGGRLDVGDGCVAVAAMPSDGVAICGPAEGNSIPVLFINSWSVRLDWAWVSRNFWWAMAVSCCRAWMASSPF